MKKDREHIDPLANWTESIIHNLTQLGDGKIRRMLDKIRVERRKAKIKRLMGL